MRAAVVLLALLGAGCVSARHPRATVLLERVYVRGDPPATARDWQVVEFAHRQIGKPYCWGGVGPSCFDCSGLVLKAWASVGVRLPHSSEAVHSVAAEVPLSEARPGDILWWPGHVAIYAGAGWSIEALDRRDGVVKRAVRDPVRVFRPLG